MLSSRKGRGACERERAASELVQVGLVGDPGVLPLGLHLWVRRHAELDAWVGKQVSTRLHGLDDFEQLTYLLAYLDEEARDHAVQQHVGEEAAAHLGGHSHAGHTERPRLVRAPSAYSTWGPGAKSPCAPSAYSTWGPGAKSPCASPVRTQPGRLVRVAPGRACQPSCSRAPGSGRHPAASSSAPRRQ